MCRIVNSGGIMWFKETWVNPNSGTTSVAWRPGSGEVKWGSVHRVLVRGLTPNRNLMHGIFIIFILLFFFPGPMGNSYFVNLPVRMQFLSSPSIYSHVHLECFESRDWLGKSAMSPFPYVQGGLFGMCVFFICFCFVPGHSPLVYVHAHHFPFRQHLRVKIEKKN